MKLPKLKCGTTRSGKSIYEYPLNHEVLSIHPFHRNFNLGEHFDCFAVFNYLYARADKRRDIRVSESYGYQCRLHQSHLEDSGHYSSLWDNANLKTAFDLLQFGKQLSISNYR